jgi:hypothetical protein
MNMLFLTHLLPLELVFFCLVLDKLIDDSSWDAMLPGSLSLVCKLIFIDIAIK